MSSFEQCGSSGDENKLPDLRNLNPEQRRSAIAEHLRETRAFEKTGLEAVEQGIPMAEVVEIGYDVIAGNAEKESTHPDGIPEEGIWKDGVLYYHGYFG